MESNLATIADMARHRGHDSTEPETSESATSLFAQQAKPTIGLGKIVLGVFLGNLTFVAFAGLVYLLFTAH